MVDAYGIEFHAFVCCLVKDRVEGIDAYIRGPLHCHPT